MYCNALSRLMFVWDAIFYTIFGLEILKLLSRKSVFDIILYFMYYISTVYMCISRLEMKIVRQM